jgi:ribulose-phosphate 3-epimerase
MPDISPSILAADLSSLATELSAVENADRIHVDIMDGHLVPNITLGFPVLEAVQECTTLPVDVHMMVTNPLEHANRLALLQAESVTVHVEALRQVDELATTLAREDVSFGLAINPSTEIEAVTEYVDTLDRVTVMGVEPGFSGQEFQVQMVERIEHLNDVFRGTVEIDGGITVETAGQSINAGADVVVSGSAIFESNEKDRMIEKLRNAWS